MRILIVDDEWMVREETAEVVHRVRPKAEIRQAANYIEALELARTEQIDIALLDIEMPGMNGLELSQKLKEIRPDTNLLFVTAYSEYAMDAFSLYPSGYLLKPLDAGALEKAFQNLRNPVEQKPKRLEIRCFGSFEVFQDGKPVTFARTKTKEVLAWLVHLQGASANTAELCAVLWEDSSQAESNKHYFRNLIADLKKTMKACGAEELLICRRNQFAVDPKQFDCDYYRYLAGDVAAVNSYRGEYMSQYSWAEFHIGNLENRGGV